MGHPIRALVQVTVGHGSVPEYQGDMTGLHGRYSFHTFWHGLIGGIWRWTRIQLLEQSDLLGFRQHVHLREDHLSIHQDGFKQLYEVACHSLDRTAVKQLHRIFERKPELVRLIDNFQRDIESALPNR
ncbi:hypothetical protein D3C85_1514410 [compost metagenome]